VTTEIHSWKFAGGSSACLEHRVLMAHKERYAMRWLDESGRVTNLRLYRSREALESELTKLGLTVPSAPSEVTF